MLIGVVAILFMPNAGAEEQPPGGPDQQQAPQSELQQIQQELLTIQQRTLDANPQLQKQRKDLESMATKAMEDEGYDPDALVQTLDSSQETLQDESASDDKRMQALEEAQQAQQELQQAQQAALQNEKVAQAHRDFQSDLMTAMREEDPKVDDLIKRFEQIQQDMQRGAQPGAGGAPPAQ